MALHSRSRPRRAAAQVRPGAAGAPAGVRQNRRRRWFDGRLSDGIVPLAPYRSRGERAGCRFPTLRPPRKRRSLAARRCERRGAGGSGRMPLHIRQALGGLLGPGRRPWNGRRGKGRRRCQGAPRGAAPPRPAAAARARPLRAARPVRPGAGEGRRHAIANALVAARTTRRPALRRLPPRPRHAPTRAAVRRQVPTTARGRDRCPSDPCLEAHPPVPVPLPAGTRARSGDGIPVPPQASHALLRPVRRGLEEARAALDEAGAALRSRATL